MTFTTTTDQPADRLRPVPFDLYRDIHKGIRAALFAVTAEAGRTDPADDLALAALRSEVVDIVQLLTEHASHEDEHLDLLRFLPELADRVTADHHALERRMGGLVELADAARAAAAADRRFAVHELYVELAAFTGAYLLHQDMEERVVMPAMAGHLSVEQLVALHETILGSMPPDELTRGLVAIFPAVNVDDRCEMLAGMRAGAPAETFAGLWRLAASLLSTADAAHVAARLGL